MFFNAREQEILDLLILYGEASISTFTNYFGISERTLRRSITSINSSLKEYSLDVIMKNDSVYLIGKNDKKNQLSLLLNPYNDYSDTEIKCQIIYHLFYSNQIFLFELSNKINTTIYSTTNMLKEIRKENDGIFDYKIEKGKGIEVLANEANKRTILHKYFYKLCSNYLSEIIQGFNSHQIEINNKIITNYLNLDLMSKVEKIIIKFHENFSTNRILSDNDNLNIILYYSIALDRVERGYYISKPAQKKTNELNVDDYDFIQHLLNIVTDNENVINVEAHYFMKLYFEIQSKANLQDEYEVLAISLIKSVEDEYDIQLESATFKKELVSHLKTTQYIKFNGSSFYESKLVSQIKNDYLNLFQIIKQVLKRFFDEDMITDERIVYIVLHFGVELLEHGLNRKKEILIVCSSGMGSSKMMSAILNKELDAVNLSSASVYKLYNEVDLTKFDLVVSTINLGNIPVPYIVVSPLISKEQLKTIKQKLESL